MASCSYSSLLEGKSSFMSFPCGSNWKNPEDFSCITLRDCNLDVSSHLTSCKVADDRIENEVQLLLARAGTVLLVIIMPDFQTFRSAFEPSLYLSYHVVSLSLLFIGVFIIEESHKLLTVCPRHRDKYGVGWRTGKVRCSIPSEIAGHKSSSAKGDRGISSKESAFVLIAGDTFLPIGTREKMKNFLTSVLFHNFPARILLRRKLPWKCFGGDRLRSLVTFSLRG